MRTFLHPSLIGTAGCLKEGKLRSLVEPPMGEHITDDGPDKSICVKTVAQFFVSHARQLLLLWERPKNSATNGQSRDFNIYTSYVAGSGGI